MAEINLRKMLEDEIRDVISDISFAVEKAEFSQMNASVQDCAYMNITTKEQCDFCVELTRQGFRIVGNKYNTLNGKEDSATYETIYALLDNISPEYRKSFGESLASKLAALQDKKKESD